MIGEKKLADGTKTTETSVLTGPAVTLDTWTHLAASYDGQTLRLYIKAAGAQRLVAVSAVLCAADIAEAIREFKQIFET